MTITDRPSRVQRQQSWRQRAFAGVVMLLAFGAGTSALWFYVLGPRPPDARVAEAGPGVAEDIAEARWQVTLKPFSASAWGNLGLVLHFYEYEAEAGRCYDRAAELDRRSPRWPYLQAVVRMRTDMPGSLAFLERAVALGGTVSTPRLLYGETLLLSGQSREAEGQFRAVLRAEPDNVRALLGLARAQSSRGDLNGAREVLQRATIGAPRLRTAHVLLAQTFHQLGDEQRASAERAAAEKLPEQTGWPDPYRQATLRELRGEAAAVFRATALLQRGEDEKALALLKTAAQRYPRSQKIHRALGRTYSSVGQYSTAEASYREAVRLNPDNLESQYEWGLVLKHQGQLHAAAIAFRQALRLRPEYGLAHYQLGQSLELTGNQVDAIAAYREAVRYQPDLADAYRALGALLVINQRDAEAESALQHALELDATDEASRERLATVRARTRTTRASSAH